MDGRRDAGGFTMIEIVAVILIVMILAGLSAPALGRGIRQSKMNSAAAEVATGLRRARSLAITRGRVHCAVFVSAADFSKVVIWDILDDGVGVPDDSSELNNLREAPDPNPQRERAGGVQLEDVVTFDVLGTQTFIAFLPDGSAWGPGMNAVTPFRVKPLNDNNPLDIREIRVGTLSGNISIIH